MIVLINLWIILNAIFLLYLSYRILFTVENISVFVFPSIIKWCNSYNIGVVGKVVACFLCCLFFPLALFLWALVVLGVSCWVVIALVIVSYDKKEQ